MFQVEMFQIIYVDILSFSRWSTAHHSLSVSASEYSIKGQQEE